MSNSNVRNVHLTYHRENGLWWVDSDDMPGFSAVGDTFVEAKKNAHEGVQFYFDDNEANAIHETLDDGTQLISQSSIILQIPETVPSPENARGLGFSSLHTREMSKLELQTA